MREEIAAAVVFLTRLVKLNEGLTSDQIEEFSSTLSAILVDRFKNHWYQEKPTKGQGYRCIRINPAEPVDPVLEKAASGCGLSYIDLNLPQELTLWVDPQEVCCRFGESQGSFCQLAVLKDGSLETKAHTINIAAHLEQQQRRLNLNTNIVMTRTSANKLKAQALKALTNQQYLKSNYHHNSKHQNNYNNNQQQPGAGGSSFSSRPFHKPHNKNNHNNHSGYASGNANNGKGSSYSNAGSFSVNRSATGGGNNFNPSFTSNQQSASKDRFRWVKSSDQSPVENMRVSPN